MDKVIFDDVLEETEDFQEADDIAVIWEKKLVDIAGGMEMVENIFLAININFC